MRLGTRSFFLEQEHHLLLLALFPTFNPARASVIEIKENDFMRSLSSTKPYPAKLHNLLEIGPLNWQP
jgi:hypothetical protein